MGIRQTRRMVVMLAVLLCATSWGPAFAGRVSVGGYGGKVWSIEDSAATGDSVDYPQTRFGNSETFGANVGYLWDVDARMLAGFELNTQYFKMNFTQNGVQFGTIKAVPLLLQAKIQSLPKGDRGFAGHFLLGGGVIFSDFNAGPYHDDGATSTTVDTNESFAFILGGGVDYFFTRSLALSTKIHSLWSSIDCHWDKEGGSTPGAMDLNRLNINNVQLLIGLQAYF